MTAQTGSVQFYARHTARSAAATTRRLAARALPIPPKPVTLALDDAPSPVTEALLAGLAARGHRGILFVIGQKADARRAVLADAVRLGFALGNHSYTHPAFSTLDADAAEDEIARTELAIASVYAEAGVTRPARWFRFPYLDEGGANRAAFQSILQRLGFEPLHGMRPHQGRIRRYDVASTLVSRDTRPLPVAAFRARIRMARPGDTIEFHDRPESVENYLPSLLDALAAARLVGIVAASSGPAAAGAAGR